MTTRIFLSWSHQDNTMKTASLRDLLPALCTVTDLDIALCDDSHPTCGEELTAGIVDRLEELDFSDRFLLSTGYERSHTLSYVPERIEWDDDAAYHIRTRSRRYADAVDIEPEWTTEAVNDPDRIVEEPDPLSAHANSVRIVGYSHSGALLITVVALRDQNGVLHGATAWPTTGKQLRQYREGRTDD